jgi:hypothetical protein
MHIVIPTPKGAITTLAHLRLMCMKALTIYKVNGVCPAVEEVSLVGMVVYRDDVGNFLGYEPTGNAGRHYCSDYNVGESYNANYMFATREDADAYAEFAKTDPAMIADRKEWLAECDAWDAYLDLYDDRFDYDEVDEFDREEGYD